ncbi:PEGA domain-containing protein [Candidatus Falkowbacteria bacterium]|nr:PEGA domain-containing protein [Candidatus Falkowbacteria bacterium]
MNKKFRDSLFFFFVFVFIFGTIFLSLYASGYKFNLSWPLEFNRLLIKTGMIALNSDPKGAIIYLDGKVQPSVAWRPWQKKYLSTPAKIKNVIPGEYEIMVERHGYWPFKTTLRVNSGLTTFYENISLFKSDNPTIKAISDESLSEETIDLSPNGHYLYLNESTKIINLNKEGERNILADYENLISTSSLRLDGSWQKNNEFLFAGIFFSPNNLNDDKNFLSLIGSEADDWKFEENSNRLFYKTKNSLSYIDLNQKQATIVLGDLLITDYLPKNKSLFLIIPAEQQNLLQEYSYEQGAFIQEISLPGDGDYLFGEEKNNYLSIYDKKNKSLYLLERDYLNRGFKKIEGVKAWQWNNDEGIFFISDWELQYFNLKEGHFDLLARLGINLEDLLINEKNKYLLLSSKQEVVVYDLKTAYMTTIIQAEKISSPVLDKNNDLLYFWGQIEDQQGVYRISVK